MAAPAAISWSEANQACLVAEFTRLKRLLTAENGDSGRRRQPRRQPIWTRRLRSMPSPGCSA